MELKYQKFLEQYLMQYVQIVPLWNWNNITTIVFDEFLSSNCTFMELKLLLIVRIMSASVCSNCTFMELKFVIIK